MFFRAIQVWFSEVKTKSKMRQNETLFTCIVIISFSVNTHTYSILNVRDTNCVVNNWVGAKSNQAASFFKCVMVMYKAIVALVCCLCPITFLLGSSRFKILYCHVLCNNVYHYLQWNLLCMVSAQFARVSSLNLKGLITVRKILSKFGSESLDTINTKHLFLTRKRQVCTTYQEAGSELSDSQNGIYIIYVYWPHNVMGKQVQTVKNNFTCYTVLWEPKGRRKPPPFT